MTTLARSASLWDRLGLGRPELRAWALYDWANSAFMTTVVAAVFPIYFAEVAAGDLPRPAATLRFSLATTLALITAAVLAPALGVYADRTSAKQRLLAYSTAIGAAAAGALALVGRGDWVLGACLFLVANIALSTCNVFYDALLPYVARPHELDKVSAAGYALGYVGGAVLLALNLAMIQKPGLFGFASTGTGVRASFVSVAIWWALFALPLLRWPRLEQRPAVPVGHAAPFRTTLRDLRQYPQALRMLIAFLLYNDGIGTIIRMATIYGAEIGLGSGEMIAALLITQLVGIPCAFAFGALGSRIGAKRAVFIGLGIYMVITALGFFMRTGAHFFALAFLVGMVQGGTQALSRSLFASLIPSNKSGEFFGFFAVTEKFAGIIGPGLFGLVSYLAGSSRMAIVTTGMFFVVGALVLSRVDVQAGRRAVASD